MEFRIDGLAQVFLGIEFKVDDAGSTIVAERGKHVFVIVDVYGTVVQLLGIDGLLSVSKERV